MCFAKTFLLPVCGFLLNWENSVCLVACYLYSRSHFSGSTFPLEIIKNKPLNIYSLILILLNVKLLLIEVGISVLFWGYGVNGLNM